MGWHSGLAGLAGLAVGWVRSSDPEAEVGRGPHPHPKLGIEVSQASRYVCVCVPHQLDGGGRVRVLCLCHREIAADTDIRTALLDDFCVQT